VSADEPREDLGLYSGGPSRWDTSTPEWQAALARLRADRGAETPTASAEDGAE
jgi:hypothetical protein